MQTRLDPNSPSPFMQPFLVLVFGDNASDEWYIDVDGKVDLYVQEKHPTPLLAELCSLIHSRGLTVKQFWLYEGSAGPTHIFRNGAIFRRENEYDHEPDPPVYVERR